jgi:hypothetical protein
MDLEEMEAVYGELYYADNENGDGDDPEPKEYYIWGMRPRPQLLIDLTGENRAPVNVAKLNQRTLDWVRELDSRPPLPLSIPKYLMGVPATSPPTKKQRHQETDGQDTKCPTSTEIEDSDGDDPEPKEYYIWGMRPRPQLLIDLTGGNRPPANVAKLDRRTSDCLRELDSLPPFPHSRIQTSNWLENVSFKDLTVNNIGDGFVRICRTPTIADQEETKNSFDQLQQFLDSTGQNSFDELQEFLESMGQKRKRVKYTNPNLPHKCVKENIPFDTGLECCILCGDPVAETQRLNMARLFQLSVDLLELLRQYLDFPTRTYLYLAGFTPTGDSCSNFPEFFRYFKPTEDEMARKLQMKWTTWKEVEYYDDREMDIFSFRSESESESECEQEFEYETKSEYESELQFLEDVDAVCIYEYIPIVRLLLLDNDFKTVKSLKLDVGDGTDEATEAILKIDPQFGSTKGRKEALARALKNNNDRVVNLFKKESFDRTSTPIFRAAVIGGYIDWVDHMITLDRTNRLSLFYAMELTTDQDIYKKLKSEQNLRCEAREAKRKSKKMKSNPSPSVNQMKWVDNTDYWSNQTKWGDIIDPW